MIIQQYSRLCASQPSRNVSVCFTNQTCGTRWSTCSNTVIYTETCREQKVWRAKTFRGQINGGAGRRSSLRLHWVVIMQKVSAHVNVNTHAHATQQLQSLLQGKYHTSHAHARNYKRKIRKRSDMNVGRYSPSSTQCLHCKMTPPPAGLFWINFQSLRPRILDLNSTLFTPNQPP